MGVRNKLASSVTTSLVLLLLIGLFSSGPAYAQVTGATLSGTITDPSGAAVAGAQVSIKNTETGITTADTSDSNGFYSAPNLPPAPYEVRVTASGFSTTVLTLTLAVGAQQTLNVPMKVGQTSQTVEVTAAAPQIDLSSSALTGQVESETVRELPLNGRDWTSLATLQPGVNKVENQMSYNTSARGNRGFGSELTVSGQRSTFNAYRIDGISVVDYANAAPGNVIGVVLGVDAIQEFSVLTGGFPAEYGRATGGVVNAISKSGTNQFHGDAYEFLRNSALDANDYFTKTAGNPRPEFRRNQFGVSAGGPIIKDKTFIFGDYEGLRQAKGIPSTIKVPSNNARLGILNGVAGGGQPANTPCTTAGTPGHYLSPAGICVSDYTAALLKNLYSVPNGTTSNPDAGAFTYAANQVVPENFYTFRVDHKISGSDSIFGTYLFDDTDYTQPDQEGDAVTNSHTRRQTIAIEENHTFSSNFVNAARIGYNRDRVINANPVSALKPDAGNVQLGYTLDQNAPRISVGGSTISDMFGGVGAGSHYFHTWNSYQAYDDAFWTHGNHTIKFGAAVENIRYNFLSSQEPGGRIRFSSLQNFLAGNLKAIEAGLPNTITPRELRQTVVGAYVQDDWRVRSNLTLNLGVRYEMATVLSDAQNKIGNLTSLVNPNPPTSISTAMLQCAEQYTAPVAPQAGTTCNSVGPYTGNQTLHNFEPRVGFAWDPFHDGKTSVRGGFGLYDVLPLPGYFLLQQNQNAPFMIFKSVTSGLNGDWLPNTSATSSTGNNTLVNSTASRLSASTVETSPKRSYVLEYNFNIQRQLRPDLALTVGYVGSHGVHLLQRGDDGNMTLPLQTTPGAILFPCGPLPAPVGGCTPGLNAAGNSAQLNQSLGVLRYIYWGTDSHYNGLNVNLAKSFGHGFQAQFAYTYSKSIDDDSQAIAGDTFANGLNSPPWFLPHLLRGPSDFDTRHSISINGLWDIPTPKSFQGIAEKALGGWEVGAIAKINSGVPTTVDIGGDPYGWGNTGADQFGLLNRVAGCNPINSNWKSNGLNYINAACFTLPTVSASSPLAAECGNFSKAPTAAPAGQVYCANLVGNSGRNSVYGPRLFDLDLSLIKNLPIKSISETFNVQFRAEMFNLTNHDNFVPPQPGSGDGFSQIYNSDGSANFATTGAHANQAGSISLLATDPREIQFALKLVW